MTDNNKNDTSKHHHSWWGTIAGKTTAVLAVIASIATIITVVPVLAAFFQKEPVTEFQRTPELALEFWDGTSNKQYPMNSEQFTKGNNYMKVIHVAAKPGPFEIRFPTLKEESHGMHICAWTDDSIFNVRDGTDFTKRGAEYNWIFDSPFVPGKGISNTTAGNAVLPITNKYNSYWIDERVEHISDTKDKIFLSKGDDEPFAKWKKNLYLTIWIDRDSSNSIDNGEYEYIVLDFAK